SAPPPAASHSLSLHDALPIFDRVTDFVVDTIPKWADVPLRGFLTRNAERGRKAFALTGQRIYIGGLDHAMVTAASLGWRHAIRRSEEHTSELQSRFDLVCRLL